MYSVNANITEHHDAGVWNKKTILGLGTGTFIGAAAVALGILFPHIAAHGAQLPAHVAAYAGGGVLLLTAGASAYFYNKYRTRMKVLKSVQFNRDMDPNPNKKEACSETRLQDNPHVLIKSDARTIQETNQREIRHTITWTKEIE